MIGAHKQAPDPFFEGAFDIRLRRPSGALHVKPQTAHSMMLSAPNPPAALVRIRRFCNFTIAGIWLYQGLVPKLLGPHRDELAMANAFGIPSGLQASLSYAAGIGEVLLGICILFLPRQAWPQVVSAVATAVLLAFVAIYTPDYLLGAFNPVVMNIASIALSVVALLALRTEQSSAA